MRSPAGRRTWLRPAGIFFQAQGTMARRGCRIALACSIVEQEDGSVMGSYAHNMLIRKPFLRIDPEAHALKRAVLERVEGRNFWRTQMIHELLEVWTSREYPFHLIGRVCHLGRESELQHAQLPPHRGNERQHCARDGGMEDKIGEICNAWDILQPDLFDMPGMIV